MNDKIYDVAIIGSGPAGLTAAIYTTRGAASTVIVGGEKWGGQLMLTTQVDNYPALPGILGPDLMQKMKDHALMFGAEFIESSAESIDVSTSPFKLTASGGTVVTKSVIIATGAETKWLDVPGVSKLIGRGVSSCAPCDAPFFKGKKVAVVGGGDSAMEEADVLTKYTSEVTLIHRRDTFRASAVMQKKVKNNPKIKILWDTEVQEVKGEERVTDLILKNNKTGKTSEFPVDGLFIAIGHTPTTAIFQEKIKLDGKGFVEKFEKDGYQTVTSVPGIFVAGDVHDWHYKQAVTAAGFGCMAAMDAVKYLEADNT
ncbi:MAG: Thioredoxin reductase [Candidatus Woesebacteria bacterium GW2011_GWB1_45_5]|uniref:Thioredoxin reductase n=1 Tax=Candidatus Woesebacteria bacterium GW2011_GWB1_45_5 TaxID=1618581 RepID=A0A0G1PWQ5_9BACT|nr:MAG: Thioredoxin reductase [Candidatus Woesebacteria bacterium GW2011_GWB1_45_5]